MSDKQNLQLVWGSVWGLCCKQCRWYRDVLALAGQGLHGAKAISAPHPIPTARGLGGHKGLGGDKDGTADPN